MNVIARHGDLVVAEFDGVVKSSPTVAFLDLAGSHSGHVHRLRSKTPFSFEKIGETRHRVVLTDDGVLEHTKEGGHTTKTLPPGNYEFYPLRERGKGEDRDVED